MFQILSGIVELQVTQIYGVGNTEIDMRIERAVDPI